MTQRLLSRMPQSVYEGVAVVLIASILFCTACSRKPDAVAVESTPSPTATPLPSDMRQGASRTATAAQRESLHVPSSAPAVANTREPDLSSIPDTIGGGGDQHRQPLPAAEQIQPYDKDGNGALDEQEYLARYIERHKRRFSRLDLNRDGQLSPEELLESERPPTPPPATRRPDATQPRSPAPQR